MIKQGEYAVSIRVSNRTITQNDMIIGEKVRFFFELQLSWRISYSFNRGIA